MIRQLLALLTGFFYRMLYEQAKAGNWRAAAWRLERKPENWKSRAWRI